MMRSITSSAPQRGIAAIVGVGPKLGRSIARKFAHEGYTVAILARDLGRLSKFADEIAREEKAQVFAIRIDCSESRSVREAFEGVLSLGFVEVLVYNACQQPPNWHPTNFTDIRLDSFEKSLAVSSVGAFHCAQQVLPGMVERGKGTILFTGCSASLNGIAGYSALCCGKFALRALSQCLSMEFQPLGVHIAHVIIGGVIGQPRGGQSSSSTASLRTTSFGDGSMDPDAVAQTYWQLHVQDRSAWTKRSTSVPLTQPDSVRSQLIISIICNWLHIIMVIIIYIYALNSLYFLFALLTLERVEEASLQEPLALELGTTWGGASSCWQRFQSISKVVWN